MLLFINYHISVFLENSVISKHLMLLFIFICAISYSLHPHFKTSHVIVYLVRGFKFNRYVIISKHLMLLFIPNLIYTGQRLRDFKTSHVIVYQHLLKNNISHATISKHLMLLFIWHGNQICLHMAISKHLMLLFIPRISAFFSFSPPLFPLIFSIFLHFLPTNILILDRTTYHPINLLIFQAFLDFSFFFRLVKIL